MAAVAVLAVVAFALLGRLDRLRGSGAAEYLGDDARCLSCHADKTSFESTAHRRTSAIAARTTILGKFEEGDNILRTPNPHLQYRMERRADGLYQTAVEGILPDTQLLAERFDLVIGSGRKGQSYLYWRGDQLFQLPVSYWTSLRGWISSPGYQEGLVDFGRPIPPRCLECHATYFEHLPGSTNAYDTTSYRLGISCESCHGPGREHVVRRESRLGRFRGGRIVDPSDLPRDRQMDGCALCHAGIGEPLTPPFSYRPGAPIEQHVGLSNDTPDEPDVHGNQVALLKRSACFRSSDMTCATCHDVHLPQRNAAAFSNRCLSCHQVQSCGLFPEKGHALARNCVDCHMPELETRQIVSTLAGTRVRPKVRTHWIKVYP